MSTSQVGQRLRGDIEALCVGPRHRDVPGSLEAAREHCRRQLQAAGWEVTEDEFRPRPALRLSDAGHPTSPLAMRWERGLRGVNLLAVQQGHPGPQTGDLVLMAHLDTVKNSIGADDNASGVAVLLEVARQLDNNPTTRVVIAIVDFEELWHLGSRHLAQTMPRPGLVVALDAVGYFDAAPGTQKVPWPLRMMFPHAASKMRAHEQRADFLLAVHRPSSAAFVRRWEEAADQVGLGTVAVCDRRWDGPGQRLTHWFNPLLMDLDRSDHEPFWRRGIPAVLLTGTATLRSPHYHRASDTPETLDYERLSQVADSLASATTRAHRSTHP